MKKFELYYTVQARRDLDEIWDYIADKLENLSAAEKTVNEILDTADQLKDFAGIGSPLAVIVPNDRDYRFLISGNYLIFYRIVDKGVYVDRILYGRRDYLRILLEDDATIEAEEN